jgi:hypothetical protein
MRVKKVKLAESKIDEAIGADANESILHVLQEWDACLLKRVDQQDVLTADAVDGAYPVQLEERADMLETEGTTEDALMCQEEALPTEADDEPSDVAPDAEMYGDGLDGNSTDVTGTSSEGRDEPDTYEQAQRNSISVCAEVEQVVTHTDLPRFRLATEIRTGTSGRQLCQVVDCVNNSQGLRNLCFQHFLQIYPKG